MTVNTAGQRLQHSTSMKPNTDSRPHQNTSKDIKLAESGLARRDIAIPRALASGIVGTRLGIIV
jgi:hypothetical protein